MKKYLMVPIAVFMLSSCCSISMTNVSTFEKPSELLKRDYENRFEESL